MLEILSARSTFSAKQYPGSIDQYRYICHLMFHRSDLLAFRDSLLNAIRPKKKTRIAFYSSMRICSAGRTA